jgi:hypothetical protein
MIGLMAVVLRQSGMKWTSSSPHQVDKQQPPSSTESVKIKYRLAAAGDK